MAIKADSYKNWCSENISPQSWYRIVLKSIDVIRDSGLALKELEEPNPDLVLPEPVFVALNQALDDLYQLKIEEGMLA